MIMGDPKFVPNSYMGLRYFKETIPDTLRRPLKLPQRMLRENHYVDSPDEQFPQSKGRFGKFAIFATTDHGSININVKSLHPDFSFTTEVDLFILKI
jgi:hypothetical protein